MGRRKKIKTEVDEVYKKTPPRYSDIEISVIPVEDLPVKERAGLTTFLKYELLPKIDDSKGTQLKCHKQQYQRLRAAIRKMTGPKYDMWYALGMMYIKLNPYKKK